MTGPIFSGPQQQPFVCKTQTQAGLGFPQVDNQAGVGMRCSRRRAIRPPRSSAGARTAPSTRSWTSSTGQRRGSSAPTHGPLPPDVATTTTLDGRTVPYVVRRERGTINRFIYAITILLHPETRPRRRTRRSGTAG